MQYFGFLCPAYFTQHNVLCSSRVIHVVANDTFPSFLRQNYIPLSTDTTFSLSIHLLMNTVDFFPHILAVVNNAAMNVGLQVFF